MIVSVSTSVRETWLSKYLSGVSLFVDTGERDGNMLSFIERNVDVIVIVSRRMFKTRRVDLGSDGESVSEQPGPTEAHRVR